ncbi:UDP-4-amino-4,6-dideoxy-N-acetyl-beta-L-altrosamine N-acetyltransferase [Paenibacillus sp. FSL H8-0537]|uniref:UDP-4-amino-4, 6-dideoxy-N-acetyl-beta-L-altrosamine N-acetyltransferase n=1 Tax=Paenibacillus sp. FSL H8-0537 TaxID=2921399 RepID=UPI003101647C
MIEFIKLREEHLEQVLSWRIKESVTKYMFSDITYNLDNQKKWFDHISRSETDKYWIISIKGVLVGVISLNGIDYAHKRTSWGLYIGEEDYTLYGGILPPYLYYHVFHELGLHKIIAEVMEGNDNIMKIHKLHGYREVGILKEHIFKYGRFHDVHVMELMKEAWAAKSKPKKYADSFER